MIHHDIALFLAIVGLDGASAFTSISLLASALSSPRRGLKLRPLGYSNDVNPPSLDGLKNDSAVKINKMPNSVSAPTMNPDDIAADDKSMSDDSIDWFNTWLPLMPVDFLDREKPTPFKLLGMDIVVWNDGPVVEEGSGKPIGFGPKTKRPSNTRREDGTWRAFVDRCPHRAAPLSEGRVEDDGSLMCSYHAWRFDGDGDVQVVPQALSTELERIKKNPKSSCNSFPTKVKNGLLWVWPSSGSDARILSELTPIVEMSLEGYFDDVDESRTVVSPWTFRFVPNGYDYFIENVIDPAHTAAAHHNLASNRYTEPRPFFMFTTREISKEGFEYEFKMNMDDPTAPDKASFSTVDRFYAPSHLRIVTKAGDDGAAHIIELYISPAAPGFCNMCTRQILIKTKDGKVKYTGRQTRDSQIRGLVLREKLPAFLTHIAMNEFFNQDFVLCAMQERILHGSGYSTIKTDGEESDHFAKAVLPISSDKGVLLFRKWFKRFSGGRIPFKGNPNFLPIDKDITFDVYNSHTRYCTACSGALENLRKIRFTSSSIAVAFFIWNPAPVIGTVFLVTFFAGASFLATKFIESLTRIEMHHGNND